MLTFIKTGHHYFLGGCDNLSQVTNSIEFYVLVIDHNRALEVSVRRDMSRVYDVSLPIAAAKNPRIATDLLDYSVKLPPRFTIAVDYSNG
jgi:hypothetical protein